MTMPFDIDAALLTAPDALPTLRRMVATALLAKPTGATYEHEVLADSPNGYLRLGEASGLTAIDSSGNSNHGTYTNGPTLGVAGLLPGDEDTAVTFDGVDDYVQLNGLLGDFGSRIGTSTVEFWIKTSTATSSGPIALASSTLGTQFAVNLHMNEASVVTAGKTMWIIGDDAGAVAAFSFGDNIYDGDPHHVVLQITGTNPPAAAAWVDGVAVTVTPWASNPASLGTFSDFTEAVSRLGNSSDSTLDEIAVYPTRLPSDRILAHYNAGLTRPTPTVDDIVNSTSAAGQPLPVLRQELFAALSLADSLLQIAPP